MNKLYRVAGLSKQAVFKHQKEQALFEAKLSNLVLEVDELRSEHPGCGVEKMYYTLKPDWLGRDKFIELFMGLGYRLQMKKNYHRTTIPTHLKFPNLIEGMQLTDKNQVWQSDITYMPIGDRFYYLVFIMDVYTRRILGYTVSDHMRSEANIRALKMAFQNCGGSVEGLIHHSDRGSQYTDKQYRTMLTDRGAQISMGLTAQDNAYAERINGIIKNEYLRHHFIHTFEQLKYRTRKAVRNYNIKRIHSELPNEQSPFQFEERLLSLYSQKRPKVIIYADGNKKIKEVSNHLDFSPENEPRAHNCPIEIINDC